MANQFPLTVTKKGSELLPNDCSIQKLSKNFDQKRKQNQSQQAPNSKTIMQLKVSVLQPEQRSADRTSQKQKADHSPRINAFFITMIMFPLFSRLIEANHLSPNEVIQKEQQQHHHRHHPHQMDSIVKKVAASLIPQQTTQSLTGIVQESTTTNTVNMGNKPPRPSPTPFTIQPSTYNSFAMAAKSRNKKMITKMLESTQNADLDDQAKDSDSFSATSIDPKIAVAAAAAAAASKSSSTMVNNMFDVDAFMPPGYDKLMPPKQNGKPTKVRFHVWVLGLDSIDEGSMSYVADIFMSQSWKDNRLVIPEDITFNVNTSSDPRGPYRLLPLTLIDKIWRPDSFFKNAKEVTFQEMTIPNHYIWLYSDNTILYMVKLTLLLSCAMKFQTYPHDTQNCTLKIESLSYTTNDLVFDWEESDPLVVEEHIELPQHDLIRKDIDYCTTDYSSGTFACVQVIFTIKRRLGYYIFHTYIPTCLIVIMSWISFWIKPEAVPARVTLCVTSLLTLSTQHAQSQKSLPPVSYIKAIDIFMSTCTVFVFASLMEYALVNILMSDELLNGWIGMEPTVYQERSTLTAPHQQQQQQKQQQSKVPTSAQSKPNQKPLHNMVHHQQPVRFHSLTKLDTLLDSNESLSNHGSNLELNIDPGIDRVAEPIILKDPMMNQTSASKLRHRNCSMLNKKDSIEDCKTNQQESLPSFLPRTNYSFLRAQSFAFNSGMSIGKTNLDHSSSQYLLQSKHKRAYTVDHVSRWVFPLSFIMLNFVYWTYYLEVWESIGIAQLFRTD